ncbi:hypothetical protein COCNU_01G011750 [Cocos nucifera]|uniref:Uncharacterized protein n=1 Tax=Cocos nucifera TaxID=13894 RepID=A0A8K0HV98_COCNU|nr:hypothetical protein COCNU_01G011750 [Cocos nucifera]
MQEVTGNGREGSDDVRMEERRGGRARVVVGWRKKWWNEGRKEREGSDGIDGGGTKEREDSDGGRMEEREGSDGGRTEKGMRGRAPIVAQGWRKGGKGELSTMGCQRNRIRREERRVGG